MSSPTIIEQPSAAMVEAARAKFWRKSVLKITRAELAARTGYSMAAISRFETGYDHHGRSLSRKTMQRYQLVCAGLAVKDFTWGVSNGENDQRTQSHAGI